MDNVTYFQFMGIQYEMSDSDGRLDAILRGTTLEWLDSDRPEPTRAQVDQWGAEAETRINLQRLRKHRNVLLLETDWSQSGDVPEATKTKWQTYRQALRDITDTYGSLDSAEGNWPVKPV